MGIKKEVNIGRIIGKIIQGVILVGTAILGAKAKKNGMKERNHKALHTTAVLRYCCFKL